MDDAGGALTAAGLSCGSCGTHLPLNSKFCNECGAPVTQVSRSAEYKQVTVLFADVVHSMDIASAVGAERLREIMADLADRCAAVVQRYGGTVDKFTGDGIMAVFGAPVALEDHAARACLAALGIQDETKRLAIEVRDRDVVDLQLRVGLNSGQVIAGEIGSGPFGYTAVGEQVGLAQRMESVAPSGGVMLSASTARLVEGAAALGEPEMVHIKGANEPVSAYRLLAIGTQQRAAGRAESTLVGRRWETFAIADLLERAVEGYGAVVCLVGPPGIGKSRLVREAATMAAVRGVDVFTAFCEAHTSQVPFHAVARLLRAAFGVEGLDAQAARDRLRDRVSDADPEDLLLFDDLLGIADPYAPLPAIDPDARRRRLTALVNAASLARKTPAVYVVEDAHWIDAVSESTLSDFLSVIPQTPSLVILTYRPEYEGAFTRVQGSQTLALAPLTDTETGAMVSQLLGSDPSVAALSQTIIERASGTPFFAEEIVRELAERGELVGETGAYISTAEVADVSVPATLQATIAARIDRLPPEAKRTLSAAAVIGSRFNLDLLMQLGVEPPVDQLVAAQFIDQVKFTREPEFVFHHPLIRAVAYEAQLKSDRAESHRRVAAAIEQREPDSVDENAALIAGHLEAAGDLHAAYQWHMRAGAWSANRDVAAARLGWERACQLADAMPSDEPELLPLRIAPRTMLCASAWKTVYPNASRRFDELQAVCTACGDTASLAIATFGLAGQDMLFGRVKDASRRVSECLALVESIGDPALTVELGAAGIAIKVQTGELDDVMLWSQKVIDLADTNTTEGNIIFGSPLAIALVLRGCVRWWFGRDGWRDDFATAVDLVRRTDLVTLATVVAWKYGLAVGGGVLLADDTALRDVEEALAVAEEASDDFALGMIKYALGVALMHRDVPADHRRGVQLLHDVREMCVNERFFRSELSVLDFWCARDKAIRGDLDGALPVMRQAVKNLSDNGQLLYWVGITRRLVEMLLSRGSESDVEEAAAAVATLGTTSTEGGFVTPDIEILRVRALLARAHGDEASYRDYRDRYRAMATELGFEGHMKWAEAMP